MIDFISGDVASLTPTEVVIANGGVGYLFQISMQTYTAIEGKVTVLLYAHESIREDAYELYGFLTKAERSLFRLLISVSGVGANTARLLLSSYETAELVSIIRDGDAVRLCQAKGIGTKTAQRIIVDLQNKVGELGAAGGGRLAAHNTKRDEALFALIALGFARAASEKVLDSLLKSDATLTVEQLIKAALRQL